MKIRNLNVRIEKLGFSYCLVVEDAHGNELSRSAECHPQGSIEHRYYIDDAHLQAITFVALNSRSIIYVEFESIKQFITV